MLTALYSDHHHLPFWHSPSQPFAIFNPEEMTDFLRGEYSPMHEEAWQKDYIEERYLIPFSKSAIWPVLLGLHLIEMPSAMAHVSFNLSLEKKFYDFPKRAWVQITTLATETGADGLPIVVKEKKPVVKALWATDNSTRDPYGFLSPEHRSSKEIDSPEFWSSFFIRKISGEKRRIQNSITKTEEAISKTKENLTIYDGLNI